MLTNRSAPPATVTPVLVYPDVRAAVAFLESAFGFRERVRIGDEHRAQMQRCRKRLALSLPLPRGRGGDRKYGGTGGIRLCGRGESNSHNVTVTRT